MSLYRYSWYWHPKDTSNRIPDCKIMCRRRTSWDFKDCLSDLQHILSTFASSCNQFKHLIQTGCLILSLLVISFLWESSSALKPGQSLICFEISSWSVLVLYLWQISSQTVHIFFLFWLRTAVTFLHCPMWYLLQKSHLTLFFFYSRKSSVYWLTSQYILCSPCLGFKIHKEIWPSREILFLPFPHKIIRKMLWY